MSLKELTPEEITAKAIKLIGEANGAVTMIGLPIGTPDVVDQTTNVEDHCTNCNSPILTTALKLEIMKLSKDTAWPAQTLCVHCLTKVLEDLKAWKNI